MTTESQGDFLARIALVVAVISATAYAVGFNLAPGTRSILSILIVGSALLLLLACAVTNFRGSAPLLFLLTYVAAATAAMQWVGYSQNFDAASRYILSLTALFSFIKLPLNRPHPILVVSSTLILAFAAFTAATSPPILVAGVMRASPFVGGEDGFHSSAIVVSALLIIIWTSPWKLAKKVAVGIPGVLLLVAYGGATEMLMIGVFVILWIAHRKKWPKWAVISLSAGLIVASIFYRDENSVSGGQISQLGAGALGSGRVDAWLERWNVFTNSDVVKQLFGTGAYSDYRVTALWWWEAKSAHSDVITFLMEFGIIGLLILVLFVVGAKKTLSVTGQMAVVSALLGMVLSNTLLDRPGLAIFWGLAIGSANWAGISRQGQLRHELEPRSEVAEGKQIRHAKPLV